MFRHVAAAFVLFGAVSPARAAMELVPGYEYTAEASIGPVIVAEMTTPYVALDPSTNGNASGLALRASFYGPIDEYLQFGGDLLLDTTRVVRGGVGLRKLFTRDELQFHADVQLATAVVAAVSLGVRTGFGVSYEVAPGWRAGGSLMGTFLLGHLLFSVEIVGGASYSF